MRKVVIDLQSKCYNTLFPFDFSFSFLYKYVCNERTDGYTRISVGRDETYKVELRKLPLACNRKLPLIPSLAVREKKVKKKQKPRNNGKKSAVLHTATCASRLEKRWSTSPSYPPCLNKKKDT
jgi:hypothetical protein